MVKHVGCEMHLLRDKRLHKHSNDTDRFVYNYSIITQLLFYSFIRIRLRGRVAQSV